MNVILPVAGLGTRLRPQTWSRPKPLVSVAGKTLLDHVIDRLSGIELDRVVFVTGYLGDQIREYVLDTYDFDAHFVNQPEQRGQSDAILKARHLVSGPTLVLFPDLIFEADLRNLQEGEHDAGIFVKPVDDPSRFGIVVKEGDRIAKLVEKPDQPVSNLAIVGIYYFSEIDDLMSAIDQQMRENLQTKGEFFLADALQIMIDDGLQFKEFYTDVWEDCGTQQALLNTNEYLLNQMDSTSKMSGVEIIPPVYIAQDASISHSIIGPNVSIGAGACVEHSIVRDSIVDRGATVKSVTIKQSIIGRNAVVTGRLACLAIGDDSSVELM